MNEIAQLSVQGVALIVTIICFTQIKVMFLKFAALIPVIVCGFIFLFNCFSIFAGV
jgi:hypothetical protein